MTHKTKGIVLRTVKYGETSVIVAIYTELFGLQSFIVNGVRTSSKKSSGKAAMFQPAGILDLVIYHNELKNLQRLREFRWAYLYRHIFFDVMKNTVALFMVELLHKCLKQPEPNAELYGFAEDAFLYLDGANEIVVANYPLFFALHLAAYFGLRIQNNYSAQKTFLDLREGLFAAAMPAHPNFIGEEFSAVTAQLLEMDHPQQLAELRLNQEKRRALLQAYLNFYALHIPDFHSMKTLPVLQTVLSGNG